MEISASILFLNPVTHFPPFLVPRNLFQMREALGHDDLQSTLFILVAQVAQRTADLKEKEAIAISRFTAVLLRKTPRLSA